MVAGWLIVAVVMWLSLTWPLLVTITYLIVKNGVMRKKLRFFLLSVIAGYLMKITLVFTLQMGSPTLTMVFFILDFVLPLAVIHLIFKEHIVHLNDNKDLI